MSQVRLCQCISILENYEVHNHNSLFPPPQKHEVGLPLIYIVSHQLHIKFSFGLSETVLFFGQLYLSKQYTIGPSFTPTTESSKYYACIQTAVTHDLGLPAARLAGHHSDAASKHSLCYFRSFSEQMVTCIDAHLQSRNISVY